MSIISWETGRVRGRADAALQCEACLSRVAFFVVVCALLMGYHVPAHRILNVH